MAIGESGAHPHQVEFINGRTRMFAIIGDPIEQVRSPEMATWEFQRRGVNAVLFPLHVRAAEFERLLPAIQAIANLDGLIITIPFKARALPFAQHVGAQAQVMGAFNAMAKRRDGTWAAEMLDGAGCVAAFKARQLAIRGQRIMLVGLGGAGGAIGVALASEAPAKMRLFDLDRARCEKMAQAIRAISPQTVVEIDEPQVGGFDIVMNATPIGMLNDARLPFAIEHLSASSIVFDAIVIPEMTPLLLQAQARGCRIVQGREMTAGQMPGIVDFMLRENGQ